MPLQELTVTGHLDELRRRVIVVLAVLAGATALCLPFSQSILGALKAPAHGALTSLVYFSPEEAFMVYMRVSIIAGLVISFPVIAYQAWVFVSPAIGDSFRRYTAYFVISSAASFGAGCAFGYFALLPAALSFLLNIGRAELTPMISATRYISFATGCIVACGIVFELPVAAFYLARAGIISAGLLRKKFKYAFIVILIVAAVITPTPDAFNMLLIAVPMLVLYELSIWVAFLAARKGRGYVR